MPRQPPNWPPARSATCLVRRQVYWSYGALERWYPGARLEYVTADGDKS